MCLSHRLASITILVIKSPWCFGWNTEFMTSISNSCLLMCQTNSYEFVICYGSGHVKKSNVFGRWIREQVIIVLCSDFFFLLVDACFCLLYYSKRNWECIIILWHWALKIKRTAEAVLQLAVI